MSIKAVDDKTVSMWLASALGAADSAARYIVERSKLRDEIVWESKSETDFVSSVDTGAEERIRSALMTAIPDIEFVGEELAPNGNPSNGLVAIVDPLDGTTNFLHGFPAYGVSICIAFNGVPMAAVVHDVARGGVYSAKAGGGAFFNDERIAVSRISEPSKSLIGTGIPFRDMSRADEYLAQLRALMPHISGVRRAGSAALDLCDVARGRFDAFWEQYLHPWDYAAGILLVREAGGIVSTPSGGELSLQGGPVVASNNVLHGWLLDMLNSASNS